MALFFDRYLTEYDESLSSDSYIDPVGTLIIWSAFGRQVFNNRVNSISNDVRNYTLNLFHHFLIRKLVDDDTVVLSASLRQRYPSKEMLQFKQACLIFLENLFVYSVLQNEKMQDVESAGILGISKARRSWEKTEGDPAIIFTHEPAGQILVRQLGLGVSGRYKTPLMEIGFFDTNYQYNKPALLQHWAEAKAFIIDDKNSLLGKLEGHVYPFLKECVTSLRHGGKLQFKEKVPEKLTKAYARAFASPRTVGSYAREFWLQQTRLDSGAAGELYKVLSKDGGHRASSQEVLELALKQDFPQEEKAKLEQIARIEPFLSDCTLLFTLMAADRTHSIGAVAERWEQFDRNADRLPSLAQQLTGYANLRAIKGSEAARRLVHLQQVANANDIEQQIRGLANYHGRVMQSRGQPAWLSIAHDGKIKMNARTMPRPKPTDWPPGAWYNNYYLPQFKSLVMGLQGGGA
ncbi:hypothetical protein SAMN05216321_106122 [Cupriavidus sp. OV038]|uniref:hypothetical protein n=1 Tax=unclassified Cupriavidus TaxID=2640874 RepID=UPI0008F15265|nr:MULTISPECIES: hypothetical protein [unclassified Cupriavidus]SFC69680.1 hypothetical protein SAMN05216321_106122 [Cupriavidus sp. OV038]SFO73320.1 hypothetical protein SAMN05216322_102122 [Cupriavidus sp. OV096]